MRKLTAFTDAAEGSVVSNLLYLRGIQNSVETEDAPDGTSETVIWVHEDDQLTEARALYEAHKTESATGSSSADLAKAVAARRKQEADSERRRHSTVASREKLEYEKTAVAVGWVSVVTGVLALAATLWTSFGENRDATNWLIISKLPFEPEIVLPEVFQGEVWRLLTPMLLHFDILHLVFNLGWLKTLGSQIESRVGVWHTVGLLLAVHAAATAAQYIFGSSNFGGMSGVNFGLFGYIWMRARFDRWSQWEMPRQEVQVMLVWFVVCFTGLVGQVANHAHAGGLVAGVLLGWIASRRR
jgi:GlpG protein